MIHELPPLEYRTRLEDLEYLVDTIYDISQENRPYAILLAAIQNEIELWRSEQ